MTSSCVMPRPRVRGTGRKPMLTRTSPTETGLNHSSTRPAGEDSMPTREYAEPRHAGAAPASLLADSLPMLRIEPSKGWVSLKLRELWEYRELLYFLIWRDVKVRYKQTALGAAWAIIQPFFTMVVFSVFFGRLAKVPSDGIPYPLFAFAALVPWNFFASGLSQSSDSLVSGATLIKKVYFPRLAIQIGRAS